MLWKVGLGAFVTLAELLQICRLEPGALFEMVVVAVDRGVGFVVTVVALEWSQAFVLVHVILEIDQRLKNSAAIFFWAGLRLLAEQVRLLNAKFLRR